MKTTFITFISLFIIIALGNAQSIKKPAVKSITTYSTDYEEGSQKPVIDKIVSFDLQGNIIEEINYKNGEFDEHFTYKYDKSGNKIEEVEYDKKDKVKKTIQYKYENNLRIERTVLDSNGNIKSKKTYKYEMY